MVIKVENKRASLEVAHGYAPERHVPMKGYTADGDWHWSQDAIAESLRGIGNLERQVIERFALPDGALTRVALHDDVAWRALQRESSDSWREAIFLAVSRESMSKGTAAAVHSESSFEGRGRELQLLIRERALSLGLSFGQDGTLQIPTTLGTIGVKISGFSGVSDSTHPSCAVLDLAWTEWRSLNFDRAFTALPARFMKQQRQVGALAALLSLPGRDRVVSLFLDSSGHIVSELNLGSVQLRTEEPRL